MTHFVVLVVISTVTDFFIEKVIKIKYIKKDTAIDFRLI